MTQDNRNQNELAITLLLGLGFPLKNIRLAMPKLTGTQHQELAAMAGTSRQYITMHLSDDRGNPKVQSAIADAWGVPVGLLFDGKAA